MSSEHKIVQFASTAAATIMESNICKSYLRMRSAAFLKYEMTLVE